MTTDEANVLLHILMKGPKGDKDGSEFQLFVDH